MVEVACVLGTLAAYGEALRLRGATSSPLANPTLVAILAIGAGLGLTGLDYALRGCHGNDHVPARARGRGAGGSLHQERAVLLEHGRALLLGAVLGAGAAMVMGWTVARALALDDDFALALTTRTATSPIAIAIADELDGAPALSAVPSIASGVVGATFGPALLDRLGVRAPVARGLAVGVTAHGIGTARMLAESRAAGPSSSVGTGLGGLLVALVVPGLWRS